MKRLSIGQVVRFDKIANFCYNEQDERIVEYQPIEPCYGVVVGQRVKQLGSYNKGSSYFPYMGTWGEEYDPPSFSVDSTVVVWEVKTGLRNQPILVGDADIKASRKVLILPYMGARPKAVYDTNETPHFAGA